MQTLQHLTKTMALAEKYCGLLGNPVSMGMADDPLKLNLPPINTISGVGFPHVQTIRALATLYLQAELEQTGIIPVAEFLAVERNWLPITDSQTAALLEEFHQKSRDWYNQRDRQAIFARLFGIGEGATQQNTALVNHDFQQRLALFAHALVKYGEDYRWGQQPSVQREIQLKQAASDLLFNLGRLQYGNTVMAAQSIQKQLKLAMTILSKQSINILFNGHGMWDTLKKIHGPQSPDLGRFVNRGQSGLRLINFTAKLIDKLHPSSSSSPLLPANSPAFIWAATWLQSSGMIN